MSRDTIESGPVKLKSLLSKTFEDLKDHRGLPLSAFQISMLSKGYWNLNLTEMTPAQYQAINEKLDAHLKDPKCERRDEFVKFKAMFDLYKPEDDTLSESFVEVKASVDFTPAAPKDPVEKEKRADGLSAFPSASSPTAAVAVETKAKVEVKAEPKEEMRDVATILKTLPGVKAFLQENKSLDINPDKYDDAYLTDTSKGGIVTKYCKFEKSKDKYYSAKSEEFRDLMIAGFKEELKKFEIELPDALLKEAFETYVERHTAGKEYERLLVRAEALQIAIDEVIAKRLAATAPATPPAPVVSSIPTPKAEKAEVKEIKLPAPVAEKRVQIIELAYMIDNSGSMGSYIDATKERLLSITKRVKEEFPEAVIRLALFTYSDYSDVTDSSKSRWTQADWIKNQSPAGEAFLGDMVDLRGRKFHFLPPGEMSEKIRNIRLYSGGDAPESLELAVAKAHRLPNWTASVDPNKVELIQMVVQAGDALGHAMGSPGDDHPTVDSIPSKIDQRKEALEFKKDVPGISWHQLHCGNDLSKSEQCKFYQKEFPGGLVKLLKNGQEFEDSLVNAIRGGVVQEQAVVQGIVAQQQLQAAVTREDKVAAVAKSADVSKELSSLGVDVRDKKAVERHFTMIEKIKEGFINIVKGTPTLAALFKEEAKSEDLDKFIEQSFDKLYETWQELEKRLKDTRTSKLLVGAGEAAPLSVAGVVKEKQVHRSRYRFAPSKSDEKAKSATAAPVVEVDPILGNDKISGNTDVFAAIAQANVIAYGSSPDEARSIAGSAKAVVVADSDGTKVISLTLEQAIAKSKALLSKSGLGSPAAFYALRGKSSASGSVPAAAPSKWMGFS